jgi:hypothetical protein
VTRVAADRRPDRCKDARADDGPDAEGGELHRAERAPQPATHLTVGDALIDGLSREELSPEHGAVTCLQVIPRLSLRDNGHAGDVLHMATVARLAGLKR